MIASGPNRVRIYSVPAKFLVTLLTGRDGDVYNWKLLGPGIPNDAIIIGIQHDFNSDEIKIKVAHASFPNVHEGAAIEKLPIYFARGPNDYYLELL